jgi:hypothetical protein
MSSAAGRFSPWCKGCCEARPYLPGFSPTKRGLRDGDHEAKQERQQARKAKRLQ